MKKKYNLLNPLYFFIGTSVSFWNRVFTSYFGTNGLIIIDKSKVKHLFIQISNFQIQKQVLNKFNFLT